MSLAHFQSLQEMIERLEQFGYKDITEEVKPSYNPYYLYICTLERPEAEKEEGPIYITLVDQLLMLLEQVDPSMLKKQVWFCESCRVISSVGYREDASPTEVIESMGRDHRKHSQSCSYGAMDLRSIAAKIDSRAALDAEETIPDWAKARIAETLFGSESNTP